MKNTHYFNKRRNTMKRRIVAIITILVMLIGATTLAAASNTNTDGSIEYKDGTIIIIPPGDDCCPCFGDEPCEGDPGCAHDPKCDDPCQCPCHEPGAGDFRDFDLGGDLYFGEWTIGRSGQFDSAIYGEPSHANNPRNINGTHTGIRILNQTAQPAEIKVSIGEFIFNDDSETILAGAELELESYGESPGWVATNPLGTASKTPVTLIPGEAPSIIITTSPGSAIAAAWSGILDVLPGTAIHTGKAQADLFWTSLVIP
jgi:hypothetical protein